MTERERFRRLFKGERVDRPPLLDEGVREEVLDQWRAQGMPAEKTHLEIFGLTPHETLGPDIRFRPRYSGRVMRLSAKEYCRAFDVSRSRFPDDWPDITRRLKHRDHVVCIWAYRGFFQALGVGDWPSLEQVLYGVYDHADEVRHRLELYGEFCAGMLEMTLEDIEPECIYLSEPISDNRGPLISPEMFERFALPAYERIIAVARKNGVEHIVLSTYGNTASLFPAMVKAGVTILWVSEATEVPEMDYLALRQQFGSSLGLIGGIPLSILRIDAEQEMERRLHEIIIPLMRAGRYLPLASGRVREEIPWPNYTLYRQILAKIMRSV